MHVHWVHWISYLNRLVPSKTTSLEIDKIPCKMQVGTWCQCPRCGVVLIIGIWSCLHHYCCIFSWYMLGYTDQNSKTIRNKQIFKNIVNFFSQITVAFETSHNRNNNKKTRSVLPITVIIIWKKLQRIKWQACTRILDLIIVISKTIQKYSRSNR